MRSGFTLVEMLVVCAILAIIMGISVGTLSRVGQSSATRTADRVLRASLVRARRTAMEKGTLSRVIIYPDGDAPAQIGLAIAVEAATLHFESERPGGDLLYGGNSFAKLRGGNLEDGGTVGRCALMSGGGSVVFPKDPALDPTRGFSLELDVCPEKDTAGPLASYGDLFSLEVTDDGRVVATMDFGEGDDVKLESDEGVLAPERWARIGLSFDGIEIRLSAHGVAHVIRAEKRPMSRPSEQARLTLGGGAFKGRIDELLYRTLGEEELEKLDPSIETGTQAPTVIRFDQQGRLDNRFHSAAVTVSFKSEQDSVSLTVSRQGVVR